MIAEAPLSLQAKRRRYDAYLSYLDELTALYGKELKVANFDAFRRRLVRHA